MIELTKAEEALMQILWKEQKAFIKDIIEQMPEPKPAYTTVSTFIRILEKKGAVGHTSFGKSHQYYPIISQLEYKKQSIKKLLHTYFDDSVPSLFSFFTKEKILSDEELKELKKLIK